MSSTSFADTGHFTTGAKLAEACYGEMSFVQGYVTGVIDRGNYDATVTEVFGKGEMSPKAYADLESMTGKLWCAPDGTVLGQYLGVACKWAKAHLEDRDKVGSTVLQRAFMDQWPCP